MLKQNRKLILCCSMIVLLQLNGIWAGYSEKGFQIDSRIINGTNASLNATKHQVSIRNRLQDSAAFGEGHICGGSLISENVVLSAAHCFFKSDSFLPKENFIVVLGTLDRLTPNNYTLTFEIKKLVTWADKFYNEDDIILIILDGKVPADHPTVQPITLNKGSIMNNTLCQVTGWGLTEDERLARYLKTVNVPIIDFNDCQRKTNYGNSIHEGMICAGYMKGERDSCFADSGGPLVHKGIQVGIVSWGIGCAQPRYPGVYTEVASYRLWIARQVKYYGASPKFASIPDDVSNLRSSIYLTSLMFIFSISSYTRMKQLI